MGNQGNDEEPGVLEIAELAFFQVIVHTKRPGTNAWQPWTLGGDMHTSLAEACAAFGLEELPERHPHASEGFLWMRAVPGTGVAIKLLYKYATDELRRKLPKRRPTPLFDFDTDLRWAVQRVRLFT